MAPVGGLAAAVCRAGALLAVDRGGEAPPVLLPELG